MHKLREAIRDVCILAAAEFLPLLRVGMGNSFNLKLIAALGVKAYLLAALPSSVAYTRLQMWACVAMALHGLGRGMRGWPTLPSHRQSAHAPGVSMLSLLFGLPFAVGIVVEPLLAMAFAWWSLASPYSPPWMPPGGQDIAEALAALGVRQWVGDAAFTMPCLAAIALFLLPLVDREPPMAPDFRERPLTFSTVRLPKPIRRIAAVSASRLARPLQRQAKERKTA